MNRTNEPGGATEGSIMQSSTGWPGEVFRVLQDLEVRQVAYVPDAGLDELLKLCALEPSMRSISLTSEEEGVALAAGAWLGGQRAVVLMQSSGIGNIINMLSMIRVCAFPLLLIATMRGEAGETNPWQAPMGENAGSMLGQAGVTVRRIEDEADAAGAVREAGRRAFAEESANAVLIAQSVVGFKTFEAAK